jgi:hypothetical protein
MMPRRPALGVLFLALALGAAAAPAAAAVERHTFIVEHVTLPKPWWLRQPAGAFTAADLRYLADDLIHQATSRPHVATRQCADAIWWAGIPRSTFAASVGEAPHATVIRSIGTAGETVTFTRCLARAGVTVRAVRER